jgi:hypothetical protein
VQVQRSGALRSDVRAAERRVPELEPAVAAS